MQLCNAIYELPSLRISILMSWKYCDWCCNVFQVKVNFLIVSIDIMILWQTNLMINCSVVVQFQAIFAHVYTTCTNFELVT